MRRPSSGSRFVDHDSRQPGGKLRTRFELIEVREGIQVSLLQRVLDFGLVLKNRARGAIQALVVPAHQDLEQPPLAGADARDQVAVRQSLTFTRTRGGKPAD